MATAERVRTARQIVRDFLREVLDDNDEVDTVEMVSLVRKRFQHDNEFHKALMMEALPVIVSTELEAVVRGLRDVRLSADGDARAKEIAALMFEQVGPGRRKSLLAMTRPDLFYAANEREHMAAGLLKWATFERELAKGMRNDSQTVGERFTDTQFETIWRSHFEPEND